ncbi:MAG: hypothetical protein ACYC97_13325 [Metallibacterium sp.]
MATPALIKLDNLRMLAEAGSVRAASIIGQRGGYAVVAQVGMQTRTLATKYNRVRMFGSADAAAKLLREAGIGQTTLDLTHYEPGRLRAARPDVVLRTRRANAALEYDTWFRGEVRKSLDKIERGAAIWHDHDEMFDRLEAYAAKRVAERDAVKPPKARRRAHALRG